MNEFIIRQEHEEFARRQDAENERQNRRIAELEESVKEIHILAVSVERMAVNMETMLTAIERQGTLIEKQNDRLDDIEKEPMQTYSQIKQAIITAVIGTFVGSAVTAIIMIL